MEHELSEERMDRLPDAELEVMLAVWKCEPPVTTARLMMFIDPHRHWKTATLLSFLDRLKKRGFLTAEKRGREYVYEALVQREEYVVPLTREFFTRLHGDSLLSIMNALYGNGVFPEKDARELLDWLENRD